MSSCYPCHATGATPLTNLPILTWIGNAAAALVGRHGAVTEQAHTAACSRQTGYDHAAKVQQAVADAQLPGPSREQLLQEVQQLRTENRQLWQWLEQALDSPPNQHRQFAVTAAAMGLSLQHIVTLLAVLVPAARLPGRSTLGRWIQHSAQQASQLVQVLDQGCQQLVRTLCLDEIFLHRQAVLLAVAPHSFAWVLGQRSTDRRGPTWAHALAAWSQVDEIAAAGGRGIESGLELVAAQRQEEATQAETSAVPLHVRLDVFPTQPEGERALRSAWAAAEAVWEEAEHVTRAKQRFDRQGRDRRQFKQDIVARAWAKAEAAFAQAGRQEAAWRRAVAALAVFRPDGQLNDRAWATAEVQAAGAALTDRRWAKTKRMLLDPRTLTFLDRLQEDLAAAEPSRSRRQALAMVWHWRQESRPRKGAAPSAQAVIEEVVQGVVARRLGKKAPDGYRRVQRVLRRVVRASSAVACLNSVVRMHQARHRTLTQGLLDLKRLSWNCRTFVSGKRRDHCPYEHLELKLPTYDPWALLQMDPEELKHHLSTSELAP